MKISKLTTLLVVDAIEPCLAAWQALGYAVVMRVPDSGTLGFAILASAAGELMLQTRASLEEDLPAVATRRPSFLLYADVPSLDEAKAALGDATVLVPHRETFYGATEAWLELGGGAVIGLSERAG
jgi:hypothetical protein